MKFRSRTGSEVRVTAARVEVPLLDLKAQYAAIKDEVSAAVMAVCESQYFILGPEVKNLEREVAAYSQAGFGIGVSSGTDALLVALMALDVGPGDEVVTTPFTFFATAGTISRVGARPVFCDIDADTYNLSVEQVRRFLETECRKTPEGLVNRKSGNRVKAIIPVHLYGQMADVEAFVTLGAEHGLAVVEDAAQAIGAELPDGKRAGSRGDIGCFSFFPSKNLGAFGDGGMCVTSSPELAEKLEVLRVHGGKPKYYHSMIGGNFRLDEIQAAVLRVKLKHLDDWTAGRQRNARRYDEYFAAAGLTDKLTLPTVLPGHRHIFNQYVIRAPRRDELREHLKAHGVGTEIYYPVPLHMQRCFADLGYAEDDLPVSKQAAAETLALPIYPELTEEQQKAVVERVAEFYD